MSYTAEQQELLAKVTALQQEKNISQNEVGKLVGISGTALSQLKSGKYPADPKKLFDTMAKYFGVKERAKSTYTEVAYADTSISSQIYDLISICQVTGGLMTAVGDAGLGKTKAAQKFVQDNPSNSILITVNPCLTNVKSLLRVLAEKLGSAPERSADALWFSIVKKLTDGMVLIFDEAQHLTLKEIETLRSFSDHFASMGQTLGICFIGNPEAIIRFGRKSEFAQISNRTRLHRTYETKNVLREDIVKLFPLLVSEHMDKEIDFLHAVAQTPQSIRGAVGLFSNAYNNGGNYTYEGLVAMARFAEIAI